MDLTPSIYASLVPEYKGPTRYAKIAWSDVTDLDKLAYRKAALIYDSLKFNYFEYFGTRKPTRVDEHVVPGHEGIRVDITAVFTTAIGPLSIKINPSNYNLFTASASAVYDALCEYPKGFCPSSISTSTIIRDHWVGKFKLHPEIQSEHLYDRLRDPREIDKARKVIVQYDTQNTSLSRKLTNRLQDLEYHNTDPENVLRKFHQIATFMVPLFNSGLHIETAIAILKIAHNHSSEIKNIREEDIKSIATLRMARQIHGE